MQRARGSLQEKKEGASETPDDARSGFSPTSSILFNLHPHHHNPFGCLEVSSRILVRLHSSSCFLTKSLNMALIQSALIWVVYAVALVICLFIASIFVYVYQAPKERSILVDIVCIFTLLSLLATVLLLPVDVALVSSTTSSKLGRRKDWATQNKVDDIVKTLEIVYYTLYSLDALLCLLVLPFTYFWHEEYDEVDAQEGNQTLGQRFWGAFKYTIGFIILVLAVFLIGFFVPVAKDRDGAHYDLDYFKHLLHGEDRKSRLLCNGQYTITDSTITRRRACSHIRSRPSDHHRYPDLHPLHCRRFRPPSHHLHQISPWHLCPNLECQYSIRAGTES